MKKNLWLCMLLTSFGVVGSDKKELRQPESIQSLLYQEYAKTPEGKQFDETLRDLVAYGVCCTNSTVLSACAYPIFCNVGTACAAGSCTAILCHDDMSQITQPCVRYCCLQTCYRWIKNNK